MSMWLTRTRHYSLATKQEQGARAKRRSLKRFRLPLKVFIAFRSTLAAADTNQTL